MGKQTIQRFGLLINPRDWSNVNNRLNVWTAIDGSLITRNRKDKQWNKSIWYLLAIGLITNSNLHFDSQTKLAVLNPLSKINC